MRGTRHSEEQIIALLKEHVDRRSAASPTISAKFICIRLFPALQQL